MIGVCFECEIEDEIDMHHVVPKSLGGTKMVPLCYKCHGLVHGRDFIKHRKLLLIGVAKAKLEGKYKGRLKGSMKTPEEFLNSEKAIDIIKCLDEGMSIRNITKKLGNSSATIQKVINLRRIIEKNKTL